MITSTRKLRSAISSAGIALAIWAGNASASVVYYDLDFEDGTLGGGGPGPGALASNIASSVLTGRSLYFEFNDQIVWSCNCVAPPGMKVSFDYYSNPGAVVTFFFDITHVIRFDLRAPGSHHVEALVDLENGEGQAFLDGAFDPTNPTLDGIGVTGPIDIRFDNQRDLPGNSTNSFEIDNIRWMAIPEPAPAALLAAGLVPLLAVRRQRIASARGGRRRKSNPDRLTGSGLPGH